MNTKSGTFSYHFSAQPPLSQNSNLNCFLCYFFLFYLLILYDATVQPYLDYCRSENTLQVKLQKLQSRAARVVTGDKYD